MSHWKYRIALNVAFNMSVTRSERVREVAEMFGVGLEDREFVVYDDLQYDVEQGDVFYITGESGSGKSIALRETARQLAEKGLKIGSISLATDAALSDRFDMDMPIIEQIGESTQGAIKWLSLGGVNDANLVIRKPKELSDGQKYRLLLAHLLSSDADVWVADEFGAVLDRDTAKGIAFQVQKAARRAGKTLMVATTHTDLVEDLNPSLVLEKRYGGKVTLTSKPTQATSELSGSE